MGGYPRKKELATAEGVKEGPGSEEIVIIEGETYRWNEKKDAWEKVKTGFVPAEVEEPSEGTEDETSQLEGEDNKDKNEISTQIN